MVMIVPGLVKLHCSVRNWCTWCSHTACTRPAASPELRDGSDEWHPLPALQPLLHPELVERDDGKALALLLQHRVSLRLSDMSHHGRLDPWDDVALHGSLD